MLRFLPLTLALLVTAVLLSTRFKKKKPKKPYPFYIK